MISLGEALKERRKSKGLTRQQVTINSGISRSYLSRIERGERFPSGRILQKLAKPLGFSEVEILKLAGFISEDDSDARLEMFKREIKREIAHALLSVYKRIDSF